MDVQCSSQVKEKLKKLAFLFFALFEVTDCNFAVNQSRHRHRDSTISASTSALTIKMCHGRSNHVYMDAQWHNLRAVVPAIKVDLIVSVQQLILINALIIAFSLPYSERNILFI